MQKGKKTEDRRQNTRQKAEDKRQKTEDKRQKTRQKTKDKRQKNRRQKTEDKRQKTRQKTLGKILMQTKKSSNISIIYAYWRRQYAKQHTRICFLRTTRLS